MFKKSNQESRDQINLVAYDIAKRGKPCLEGELVKDCILKDVKIVCPDELPAFQNVSLSRMIFTCKVEEIGSDINDHLNSDIAKHLVVWLVMNESADIS